MNKNFSQNVKNVLNYGNEEVIRLGHSHFGTEHIVLGIIRENNSNCVSTLIRMGVDMSELRRKIEALNPKKDFLEINTNNIPFTKVAERALKTSFLEAKLFKSEEVEVIHLLLCIIRIDDDPVTMIFKEFNVDVDLLREQYKSLFCEDSEENDSFDEPSDDYQRDNYEEDKTENEEKIGSAKKIKSNTPVLDNFGRDITKIAINGDLDPVIGREKEIERVSQILSRRKKNNPLLVGEPGVGKSAIAEGLALRIIQKKVSRVLYNKRIVSLDIASLVAGTKYRGQFEERVKAIMSELTKNDDIILFIDEIHTIVGAGSATGSLDASNIFKPALARGEIQCIGATTLNEYRQYIEKDGALERRFQKVLVEQTSPEETILILNQIKEKYEEHHNVLYTEDAIKACVSLTSRYMTDRFLPDKAIDALDEAGSRVHINNIKVPKKIVDIENKLEEAITKKKEAINGQRYEEAAKYRDTEKQLNKDLVKAQNKWEEQTKNNKEIVTQDNVAEVVSMISGIPVNKISEGEFKKLSKMSSILKKKIIGQDQAVEKIVRAIKRNRSGLKDPNRPIGSFIFLGSTGVGKTQLAKVISEELFSSIDSLIRIDMSEYMEKFAASRLIGAPPGYVGYEEGGQLTEAVRRKPYSVVLLDEIEKAHPDVFSLLLQILDDGHITDSLGRRVDFRNTIIILTSNIGSRELKDFGQGVGFGTSAKLSSTEQRTKSTLENALKKTFAPEFLNRIDDVVIFNNLSKDNIFKIIEIELTKVVQRVQNLGYIVEIDDKVREYVTEKGWDKDYGARPLKRAIQKYIEDVIAEGITTSKISNGDKLSLSLDEKEQVVLSVQNFNKEVSEN